MGEARRDLVGRIWARDPAVWGPGEDDPRARLGWLDLPEAMGPEAPRLEEFGREAAADFDEVVLLGMGGSSLAPEVFGSVFGAAKGHPRLTVLDTTHPDHIGAVTERLDLARTLFLVSSKSGTTVETTSLYRHFRAACDASHFVAITDPGTPLARLAEEEGFRTWFATPSDVGGRYSALSPFGLVPAALLGIDLAALLEGAREMARRCRTEVPPTENPGLDIGLTIGEQAAAGRDKLTFVVPSGLATFGDWVEQLLAESTGKQGRGIAPIVREPIVEASEYLDDRAFVMMRLGGDSPFEEIASDVRALGYPVATVDVPDAYGLGAEMFRWEFATAVACAVLEVNAFDQPDVESAKRAAKEALAGEDAEWPEDDPDELFDGLGTGDLACVLAFAPPTEEASEVLRSARGRLVKEHGVATSAGFGPRYLHSTGQLHKGGPKGVRALVVLAPPEGDVAIPGEPHGFARLMKAQARGDADALAAAGKQVACTTWERLVKWSAG